MDPSLNPYTQPTLGIKQETQKPMLFMPKAPSKKVVKTAFIAPDLTKGDSKSSVRASFTRKTQDQIYHPSTLYSTGTALSMDNGGPIRAPLSSSSGCKQEANAIGFYPTTLPFVRPLDCEGGVLSAVPRESAYSLSDAASTSLRMPVPTLEIDGTPLFSDAAQDILSDSGRLMFFQLPAALPLPEYSMQPGSPTKKQSPSPEKGGDGALPASLQKQSFIPSLYTAAASARSAQGSTEANFLKPPSGNQLEKLPSGKIGRLLVYKSGKMALLLNNGTRFNLISGGKPEVSEEVVAIDTAGETATCMGQIASNGIFCLDYLSS